jgi:hypothetical protein
MDHRATGRLGRQEWLKARLVLLKLLTEEELGLDAFLRAECLGEK